MYGLPILSNILSPFYRQNDIGEILSTPLGTENLTPLRPRPMPERIIGLPTTSVGVVSDQLDSGAKAPSAGITMAQTGGGLLVLFALIGAGIFAWVR